MMETQILDDATLEKVSVIEDINKCKILLDAHNLEPEEFDKLYDKELNELVFIQGELSQLVQFRAQAKRIAGLLRNINRTRDNGG